MSFLGIWAMTVLRETWMFLFLGFWVFPVSDFSFSVCSHFLPPREASIFRREKSENMLGCYQQLAARPSYQDSLKILEVDVHHANMLWVSHSLSYCFMFFFIFQRKETF